MEHKSIIILAVCLALGSVFCCKASAAFTYGIERFNGTVKDTTTWEEYSDNAQFFQNGMLELVVPAGFLEICDYTTKSMKVGIGEAVSVEIHNCQVSTAPHAGSFCGLYLTDDSEGTSRSTLWDDNYLGIIYTYSSDSGQFYPFYGGDGSTSGYGFGVGSPPPTPSDPYLFTIERLTSNSAYYSVHHLNTMELIGSRTLYFSGIDNSLYISLMANVPAIWDNVAIPEPASVMILGLGSLFFTLRRRRRTI